MSWLSQLKNKIENMFSFSPLVAAAARAASSTLPSAQAVGAQLLPIATAALQDGLNSVKSGNSAMAAGSTLITELENGANALVSNYAEAAAAAVPLVGGMIAPEAKALVLASLQYGEQHLHDFVAALFAHHSNVVNAVPVVSQAGSNTVSQVGAASPLENN